MKSALLSTHLKILTQQSQFMLKPWQDLQILFCWARLLHVKTMKMFMLHNKRISNSHVREAELRSRAESRHTLICLSSAAAFNAAPLEEAQRV